MTKTIDEIAYEWLEQKKLFVKRSTIATYATSLQNQILPSFKDKKELLGDDVQAFVFQKLDEGYSQKTVKDMLTLLNMIKRYAERMGYYPLRMWDIKLPLNTTNKKIEVLDLKQQRRIISHIQQNFHFKHIGILISLCTGVRIGELCALTWGDIDLQRGVISITKTLERIYTIDQNQLQRTEIVIDVPKTKSSIREVPIPKEIKRIIKPMKQVMNSSYYVLTNDIRPTEPRVYRNYYKRFIASLGITPIKFHSLRHSFATRCIESNCDYKIVSDILGHSNISTTLNLYVHTNLDQKKRCIDKMLKCLK